MRVRLHNLSARTLLSLDAESVASLMIVCDIADFGSSDRTKEDVQKAWQTPGFHLKTDAWAIVTRKGQLVGYADVQQDGVKERLTSSLYVHPNYRGRGIGTLLTWLVEERARALLCNARPGKRVVLSNTVSNLNQVANRLLEREGYILARRFWRVSVEMEEASSYDDFYQHGKPSMNLRVDVQNLFGATHLLKRTGMYVARQYNVYEKELRADAEDCAEEVLNNAPKEPLPV